MEAIRQGGGVRLDEIVTRLGGQLDGDGNVLIEQVAPLASARSGQIAFLSSAKYHQQLQSTGASAVIVSPDFAAETPLPKIIHANPYAYYAKVVALLNPPDQRPVGPHPSAVVGSDIPATTRVGERVVIGKDVVLGENVMFYPGCVIGDGVSIGDDSILYPNVVIYRNCTIGRRAIIQAGAVIGSDGFGFAKEGERWVKIPQIGRVVIGDDVEIGANTSVDRGALDDTVIGDGVKLDNQIQIAHNVHVGEHTAMAGCVGIAGSARIGRRCTIGGAGMIVGHIEIADDTHVSAGTMITKSLSKPGQYTGAFPMGTHEEWLQTAVQLRRLAKLAERVAGLERKLKSMEKQP